MSGTDVINLSITREAKSPSRAGFNRGLTLATSAPLTDWDGARIRQYTGNDSGARAVRDDFGPSSPEYAWAQQLVGMPFRKPDFFQIGTRLPAVKQQKDIEFSSAILTGQTFVAVINGKSISVPFATDMAGTLAAAETAIEGCPGIDSVTASGGDTLQILAENDWQIEIDSAEVTGSGVLPGIEITTTAAGRTIAADVDDMLNSRLWYCLQTLDRSAGAILEASRAIQTAKRIYTPLTLDADNLDDSETLSVLQRLFALQRSRTGVMYHDKATQYLDAAVLGRFFPLDPGQIAFTNKPLPGITLPDTVNSTNEQVLKDFNGNYMKDIFGRTWFWPGKMADGYYWDTVRNIDWLDINLLEDLLDAIEQRDIIPYDQEGIDSARSVIANRLKIGASKEVGILRPNYTVAAIQFENIPKNVQDNRLLPDLYFEASLKGAIQSMTIRGRVSI